MLGPDKRWSEQSGPAMAKTSWTPRRGLLRITLGSGPLTRASDRLQALARVAVLLALLAAVPRRRLRRVGVT
jgi:hypothetical protein